MFKMTDACRPDGLEVMLAKLGFEVEMKTHLMTASVDCLISVTPSVSVQLDEKTPPCWFQAYTESSGYSSSAISARRSIIGDIKFRKTFASVVLDGKIAGIGLGVVNSDWLGLLSIVTYPHHRRKGIGISINQALGAWAKQFGAKNVYVQVEIDNHSSIELYKKMGFKTLYNYWYRVRRNHT